MLLNSPWCVFQLRCHVWSGTRRGGQSNRWADVQEDGPSSGFGCVRQASFSLTATQTYACNYCKNVRRYLFAYAHINTHTRTHMCMQTNIHLFAHAHTYTQMHVVIAHTQSTHTHSLTKKPTHTYLYASKHTLAQVHSLDKWLVHL